MEVNSYEIRLNTKNGKGDLEKLPEFEYEFVVLTPSGVVSNITSISEVDCFAVRAFVDLKEMRQKYERIYVKLVSWLCNSKPGWQFA